MEDLKARGEKKRATVLEKKEDSGREAKLGKIVRECPKGSGQSAFTFGKKIFHRKREERYKARPSKQGGRRKPRSKK